MPDVDQALTNVRCRHCANLVAKTVRSGRTIWKCGLVDPGAALIATDVRLNWPASELFEEPSPPAA